MTNPELIYAIGTGLVAAVATLWRIVIKRANDCERKHENTQKDLLRVTGEVGELKGRISIAEQIGPKLDEIHKALREDKSNPEKK